MLLILLFNSIKPVKPINVWLARILGIDLFRDRGSNIHENNYVNKTVWRTNHYGQTNEHQTTKEASLEGHHTLISVQIVSYIPTKLIERHTRVKVTSCFQINIHWSRYSFNIFSLSISSLGIGVGPWWWSRVTRTLYAVPPFSSLRWYLRPC